MALLPFEELIKVDVRPFCETRKAKDDNGNMVDIPYLNWAKCVKLLHENGAKDVWFTPRVCPETKTYLWPQADVTTRKGYKTQCWFVSVEIHIDELVFNMDTPLLNGALVVYEDTLNQLRISNAQARAFVKGVALRTGLGFDLWAESGDGAATASGPSGNGWSGPLPPRKRRGWITKTCWPPCGSTTSS